MVEIKREDVAQPVASSSTMTDDEESQHRLLYSKSKVYVNPTAYARDNIPGFVALVKRVSTSHSLYARNSLFLLRKQRILVIYWHGFPNGCSMREERVNGTSLLRSKRGIW